LSGLRKIEGHQRWLRNKQKAPGTHDQFVTRVFSQKGKGAHTTEVLAILKKTNKMDRGDMRNITINMIPLDVASTRVTAHQQESGLTWGSNTSNKNVVVRHPDSKNGGVGDKLIGGKSYSD